MIRIKQFLQEETEVIERIFDSCSVFSVNSCEETVR